MPTPDYENKSSRRPQAPREALHGAGAQGDGAGSGGTRGSGAADARTHRAASGASGGRAAQRRSKKKVALIVGGTAVGCLVSCMFAVLAIMLFGATLGLSSCMTSCSDSPIGDSRQVAAFIAAHECNARDLPTFDALRGSIDAVYDSLADRSEFRVDGKRSRVERPMSTDDLREAVAAGAWPTEPDGFGDVDNPLSPQLWVRIAELAQDHLEQATGETWEVVDFAYPFPDNGPIPVPSTRDEYDSCRTRLLCTDGDDAGLYVTVRYYRWAREAYFEDELDYERESLAERQELLERLRAAEALQGRTFVVSRNDLRVWCQGDDDPLRDPEAFVTFANDMAEILGEWAEVSLVEADAPATLAYNPLGYDYPNERPKETVTPEEAQRLLTEAGYTLWLDYDWDDLLLKGYRSSDEPVTLDNLSGSLAPR